MGSSSLSSSSSSSNANSPPSLKKYDLPVKTEITKEVSNTCEKNESSASHLASSQNIENFLTKQQSWNKTGLEGKGTNNNNNIGNMKEERPDDKEKITGIGNKKSLFERSVNRDILEDKKSIRSVKIESKTNNKGMTSNNYKNLKSKEEPRLPDMLDSSDVEVSKFLATVSRLAAEKEKKTGNGKLDMSELAGVLSSINNERTVPNVAKQNTKQETFNQKIYNSQWDAKKTSSSTTPSS